MPEPDSAPWSESAEMFVLGCLMLGDEPARKAVELVPVEAFYVSRHRTVFRAARRILARGDLVDVVTLSDELKSAGRLDDVGGMGFVSELVDATPSPQGLETWARKLRERWSLRETAQVLREEMDQALENGAGDPSDLWGRLEARIGDLREVHEPAEKEDRRRIYMLRELQEDPDLIREPEPLVTGLLYPGFSTMIAGREKLGKSTVAFAAVAAVCRGEDLFAQDDR